MGGTIEWSTIGPLLIGGLGVVVWSLLRAPLRAIEQIRRDLDSYARRPELQQLEQRLRLELNEIIFRADRHEENSTSRWLQHRPLEGS